MQGTYTAYDDGTECSETSAYKIQTPGNHPKERKQHSEHGESLKSRKIESSNLNSASSTYHSGHFILEPKG
jgi:hypothetical protein